MIAGRNRLVIACGAVVVAMTLMVLFGPWAHPPLIRAKVRAFGPGLAYAALASDDAAWSRVLAGVRTGDPDWFEVAAILRPALDTHPGEEMLSALAGAIESNPRAAVERLLPVYGVEPLCGQDDEGRPAGREQAARRRRALQLINLDNDPRTAACVRFLEKN